MYTIILMNDNIRTITELMLDFYRVVNKVNELEKKPYDFGIGEKLYPSEIHTIQAIGNNSGINVTALAQKLGITKGGVSQMISKLRKRGFIKKVRSMDNDKEVLLILTEKGQKAFSGHDKFHNDMYMDFVKYMKDISQEQIDMFKAILDKVDFYVDQYRVK
jgi:DNA-binding MarR family transcriptional regulator